ncbi:MAG TPA: hypothetical protein VNN72_20360 [Polyangiaceae bacterium]|nr:hypothetical protein [Polyangiaceae bacterium]
MLASPLVVSLEAIRTDGWFERVGEGIGSFQALCEIVGARFFGFAMITGARITSLTVDRRVPENTLVEFAVGADEEAGVAGEPQRLTLGEFRHRLVNALVIDEPHGPSPKRATDLEAVQLHIGVRYLLLAPLYGYALRELRIATDGSQIVLLHDGLEETYPLAAFRARIRTHVREELERVRRPAARSAIDLSRVAEAQAATQRGDHVRVLELLGAWPAPLAIFLRTPEGQLLNPEARSTIARGLGLLGSACIALGEGMKGEEILRLGIQYAAEGEAAPDLFLRLGEAMLGDGRAGEAIGPLRRAANLGANPARVWTHLARAFIARGRSLAALGAVIEARAAGAPAADLDEVVDSVKTALGPAYERWEEGVRSAAE